MHAFIATSGALGQAAYLDPVMALREGGLWPGGWPSHLYRVRREGQGRPRLDGDRVIGNWKAVEELEVGPVLRQLFAPFGSVATNMAYLVEAWREALGRPLYDPAQVMVGLRLALAARGLERWELKQGEGEWDVARQWRDELADQARAAWDKAVGTLIRAVPAPWDEEGKWRRHQAREEWDVQRAWRDNEDARASALVHYTVLREYMDGVDPSVLNRGLLHAYKHGLGQLDVAPGTLYWQMRG